ncbi:MAG: HU family DNA-binding protein [Prevotella sp.]|nr:HU family DNA-binding protein [Prevotella sp.]
MARLRIKTYKNNNSKNNAYGKTYGRLVYVDTLDTSDLCRHMMKHGTIYTPDVVKGVVERFVMCFEELLLEGNKIKLDGLGTFYLSVSTEGVDNEDQFTANNVKAIRIKFIGDQSKESEYATKMLTNKAKFQSMGSKAMPGAEEGEGENNG